MSEFYWTPDRNFEEVSSPKVKEAKFDDGYSHRLATTLNGIKNSWNLVFKNRDINTIETIKNFITIRKGVISFTWTPPGSQNEVRVICTNWRTRYITNNIGTISLTFKRVYE